jgi:hypothetical protein
MEGTPLMVRYCAVCQYRQTCPRKVVPIPANFSFPPKLEGRKRKRSKAKKKKTFP